MTQPTMEGIELVETDSVILAALDWVLFLDATLRSFWEEYFFIGVVCLLLLSLSVFIPNSVSLVLGRGASWIFSELELGLWRDHICWKVALLFCDLALLWSLTDLFSLYFIFDFDPLNDHCPRPLLNILVRNFLRLYCCLLLILVHL